MQIKMRKNEKFLQKAAYDAWLMNKGSRMTSGTTDIETGIGFRTNGRKEKAPRVNSRKEGAHGCARRDGIGKGVEPGYNLRKRCQVGRWEGGIRFRCNRQNEIEARA